MTNIKTCSFTGYRPDKLPFGADENDSRCVKLKGILEKEIEKLILAGCENFLTGMAQGVDMICGEIVLSLRTNYPNISLSAIIPCIGQEKRWDYGSITRYNRILQRADNVVFVSRTPYFNGCMQKRNRYLVDNCDLLLAVFDGKAGGTMKTVEYAKKTNRRLLIIDPCVPVKISLCENDAQVNQLSLF